MIVTGYALLDAIRQLELKRNAALESFGPSLHKFEDEEKRSPDDISQEYIDTEEQIAVLQTAQAYYNTHVKVQVKLEEGDKQYYLSTAIKLVGGAGRLARLWRDALPQATRSRFGLFGEAGPKVRKKDDEYQVQVLSNAQTLRRAQIATKFSGALRAAIARGNTEEVNIPWLPSSYLKV